ncbi:hypothetical protein PSYJA_45511, partial [Pseudomonas syringae pv. japonica str. M301072]
NVHKTYRVAGKEIPALHPTSLRVDTLSGRPAAPFFGF